METRPKYLLVALTLACAACAGDPDENSSPDSGTGSVIDSGGSPPPSNSEGGVIGTTDSGTGNIGGGDAGSVGGGDGGGAVSADCTGDVPTNNDDLITSFEDGTVGVNAVTGRGGGFYIFNDKMNDPVAQTFAVKAAPDRCSDSSNMFAFCTQGGGFAVWGAGFGTDLGVTDATTMKKTTVDLSAYTGISFWIIRNSGTAPTAKLILADKNTAEEGGNCTNMAGAMDKDKCDPYAANVPLSAKWTKQTIKFSTLKQGAWGKPSPMFAAEAVYGIQFQFAQMINFDVCFDQLVLVR